LALDDDVFDIRIGLVRDAVDRFPNSGFCMAARSPIIAGSSPRFERIESGLHDAGNADSFNGIR